MSDAAVTSEERAEFDRAAQAFPELLALAEQALRIRQQINRLQTEEDGTIATLKIQFERLRDSSFPLRGIAGRGGVVRFAVRETWERPDVEAIEQELMIGHRSAYIKIKKTIDVQELKRDFPQVLARHAIQKLTPVVSIHASKEE